MKKHEKHEEKEEFETIKKTGRAHGTLSEETAEEKAKNIEGVTKKLIEEEIAQEELVTSPSVEDAKEILEETQVDLGVSEHKKQEDKQGIIGWEPKTKLGKEVKNGKITNIDEILNSKRKILEEQIVDYLLNVKTEISNIGQSKGKFGGGKRRAWRQTQKKTKAKNVPTFSAMAIIGDEDGHVGIGVGKAKETLPARDKAIRKAKLNLIKITRTCSSFDCNCMQPHTVPFKIEGRSSSVRVILIPAPQGTGLVAANELKKILKLAGVKDVYTKTFGQQRTTFNLVEACFNALKKTNINLRETK